MAFVDVPDSLKALSWNAQAVTNGVTTPLPRTRCAICQVIPMSFESVNKTARKSRKVQCYAPATERCFAMHSFSLDTVARLPRYAAALILTE